MKNILIILSIVFLAGQCPTCPEHDPTVCDSTVVHYVDSINWIDEINWVDSIVIQYQDSTILHIKDSVVVRIKDSTVYHHEFIYDTVITELDTCACEEPQEPPEPPVQPTSGFFVSPDGNNSNPGTYERPWKTPHYATAHINNGDTLYMMGGVYYMDNSQFDGWDITTPDIVVINYPGQTPVIDGQNYTGYAWATTRVMLSVRGDGVTLKGLVFRNFQQLTPADEVWMIETNADNVTWDNCVAYNGGGAGFVNNGNGNRYINCDSYSHWDAITTQMPGNDGSGFIDVNFNRSDTRTYYRGCRAWNCGDQGFSSGSGGYAEYDGCWSFSNGIMEGEGHGFKLGWVDDLSANLQRLVKNCLAADNKSSGFNFNNQGYVAINARLYNNTAYHNGLGGPLTSGFVIWNTGTSEATQILRNNISAFNSGGAIYVESGANYTHSNNSWDSNVQITYDDFVSTQYNLKTARINGELPDNSFLELTNNSDLIDAGIDVGLPYLGIKPDLGYKEKL